MNIDKKTGMIIGAVLAVIVFVIMLLLINGDSGDSADGNGKDNGTSVVNTAHSDENDAGTESSVSQGDKEESTSQGNDEESTAQSDTDESTSLDNDAESTSQSDDTSETQYVFRTKKLLNDHYEKHGIEMGFASAEEYEAAASAVINNPAALTKTEAEDGDYVYYVEETNEFVILSTDGYIRTYFYPSAGKAYYDRQ